MNKNFANLPCWLSLGAMAKRKVLETTMAVNIDTKTPIPSVKANPLTADVPNQNKITAVIIEEIFESRIESQAR